MLRKLTFFLSLPFLFFFVAQPFVVATKTSNLPAVATKNGILQDFNAILRRRGHVKKIAQAKLSMTSVVAERGKLGGEASVSSSIFNLAKSVVGIGVLSLPGGAAFVSDSPATLFPACMIGLIMGLLAGYCFSAIGKACEMHQSKSFQDVWAKSVNPQTAWMISAGITAKCLMASLACSIIIGDTFTALAQTFGFSSFFQNRRNIIILLTSTILFPLCSMESLSALAPFSILGLGGIFYTALFMTVRYIQGSYSTTGKYFADVVMKPSFNQVPLNLNNRVFVLLSMLSTSFIAHYNAPKFYSELKNPDTDKFNSVVSAGFGLSILFNLYIMCIGFLTFGGNSLGLVLNNYSGQDMLATYARVAIGAAILTGYPFTFSALREGILDLMNFEGETRKKSVKPLTVGLLTIVTVLALLLKDVGFVVSLSGSLFGCSLMFIVPAIMTIQNSKKMKGTSHDVNKFEISMNYGIIALGVVLTIIGTGITINRQLRG